MRAEGRSPHNVRIALRLAHSGVCHICHTAPCFTVLTLFHDLCHNWDGMLASSPSRRSACRHPHHARMPLARAACITRWEREPIRRSRHNQHRERGSKPNHTLGPHRVGSGPAGYLATSHSSSRLMDLIPVFYGKVATSPPLTAELTPRSFRPEGRVGCHLTHDQAVSATYAQLPGFPRLVSAGAGLRRKSTSYS
jgi:hypothetical protein